MAPGLPTRAHTDVVSCESLSSCVPVRQHHGPHRRPLLSRTPRLPRAVPPIHRPGPSEAPRAARHPTRRARICCPAGRRAPSQADRAQTPRSAPGPERHAGRTPSDLGTKHGKQLCASASAGTRARPAHTARTRAGQLHGHAAVLPTGRAWDPRRPLCWGAARSARGPAPAAGSGALGALRPHGHPCEADSPPRLQPGLRQRGLRRARGPPALTATARPPRVPPQNAPPQHPAPVTR